MVRNGWTPCLEFANPESAYIDNTNVVRIQNGAAGGYYDNRYWTMWKLPMFGCTDGSQVIGEIANCTKAFPDAYVRVVAFDASRQVQVAGFLVHRPPGASDFQAPSNRSL
jgi:ribulose-bisphosphate carboxylase small chain